MGHSLQRIIMNRDHNAIPQDMGSHLVPVSKPARSPIWRDLKNSPDLPVTSRPLSKRCEKLLIFFHDTQGPQKSYHNSFRLCLDTLCHCSLSSSDPIFLVMISIRSVPTYHSGVSSNGTFSEIGLPKISNLPLYSSIHYPLLFLPRTYRNLKFLQLFVYLFTIYFLLQKVHFRRAKMLTVLFSPKSLDLKICQAYISMSDRNGPCFYRTYNPSGKSKTE